MSTYLELVNGAIQEAGKDQDDLTSANFASPPDPRMYNRFKRWVNQAYREIQMARNEWESSTARASVFLYPGVYVENGNASPAPTTNDTLTGNDTGFSFDVLQVILHSGVWASGTAKATIYFDNLDGDDFKLNETFDMVGQPDMARAKGYPRYDFTADGQLTDFLEFKDTTFRISTTGGSSVQTNDGEIGTRQLQYLPWDTWVNSAAHWAGTRGEPQYFTIAPDGGLEFWPQPEKAYVLSFEYVTTDGTLSAHGDTPTKVPSRYHDIIMWMAVRKSGMYDRDRAITSRADEHIRHYRNALERNEMPQVSFAPSVFNYD